MKQKLTKNCTGLNCPERICSKCQVGHSREVANEVYQCSNCHELFIGNPCTAGIKYTTNEEEAEYDKNWAGKKFDELAGEKNWKGDFEMWFEFEYMGKVGEFWQLTDYIENLLKSERQKFVEPEETIGEMTARNKEWFDKGREQTINDIELLIVNEANLARSDGFPTSRLTSLFNKIKKLK